MVLYKFEDLDPVTILFSLRQFKNAFDSNKISKTLGMCLFFFFHGYVSSGLTNNLDDAKERRQGQHGYTSWGKGKIASMLMSKSSIIYSTRARAAA